jgi:hypothetical protein
VEADPGRNTRAGTGAATPDPCCRGAHGGSSCVITCVGLHSSEPSGTSQAHNGCSCAHLLCDVGVHSDVLDGLQAGTRVMAMPDGLLVAWKASTPHGAACIQDWPILPSASCILALAAGCTMHVSSSALRSIVSHPAPLLRTATFACLRLLRALLGAAVCMLPA